jgi:hypothetical protein
MRNSQVERKAVLDHLLLRYKAQPVGSGYIDVIVMRENYKSFAKELIKVGFDIDAVSWWEYIDDTEKPNSYGYGGPRSHFYPGWFAETCTDTDEIPNVETPEGKLAAVIDVVENKVLGEYGKNIITYKTCPSLTPAFWLKVDEEWKHVQ